MRRWLLGLVAMLAVWAQGTAVAGSFCDYSNIFDPDNYVKNQIQAVESVKTVIQLGEQYAAQLLQYKTQLEQLKRLPDAAAAMARNTQELADAQQLLTALRSLHGTVQQARQRFQQRLAQAKTTGGSWEAYLQWERARIDRNVQAAVAGAQEETRALQRVQRDYEFAREMADRIPQSAGMQQAAQNLNLQMNRLVSQQAELARIMAPIAAGQGALAEATQQRAERDKFRAEQFRQLNDMTKARQQSERSVLEGLR